LQSNNNISDGLNRYLSEPTRGSAPQYLYAIWSHSISSTSAAIENATLQVLPPLTDSDDSSWDAPSLVHSGITDNDGTLSTSSSALDSYGETSSIPDGIELLPGRLAARSRFLEWLATVPGIRQYADDQLLREVIRAVGAGLALPPADYQPSVQIISDELPGVPNSPAVDIPNTDGPPRILQQAVQIADNAPGFPQSPAVHAPDAEETPRILAQDSQIADNSSGVPLPSAVNILDAPILAQDAQRDNNISEVPQPLPEQQPASNGIPRVLEEDIYIVGDDVPETAQLEDASNTLNIPKNHSGRKRKRGISPCPAQKRRQAKPSSQEKALPASKLSAATSRKRSRDELDTEPDEHAEQRIKVSMKFNGGKIPLKCVAFGALRRAVKTSIDTQKTLPYRIPFGNGNAKRKIRTNFDKTSKDVDLSVVVPQAENEVPPFTDENEKFVAQSIVSTTNSEDAIPIEKLEADSWKSQILFAMIGSSYGSEIFEQCVVHHKLSPEKKKTHRCREEKPANLTGQLYEYLSV
jgi:hypothetical protein